MPHKNIRSEHISLKHELYPDKLKTIDSAPNTIFYRGNLDLLHQPIISVVGSRNVTNYGITVIEKLVPKLVDYGAVIASGLALGCDAVAQKTALDHGGPVVAVLPGSVDSVYPKTNLGLAQRILDTGGLIISDNQNQNIRKESFLLRNRIVSGICDGLIVVEASLRSGTTSTVNHALRQGREVMAVPGDITRPTSAGCNHFIAAGAHSISSADDVLSILQWTSTTRSPSKPIGESSEETAVLEAIGADGASTESICKGSGLDITAVSTTLTMLELRGLLFNTPNGTWHLR